MKKILVSILLVIVTASSILFPTSARAAEWGEDCMRDDVATIGGVGCMVENLLTNALKLLGLFALIFVAIGAFRWLSSSGDAKALDGAKKTISTAILGLVLAVGAWFIFQLISLITGVDLSNFSTNLPN